MGSFFYPFKMRESRLYNQKKSEKERMVPGKKMKKEKKSLSLPCGESNPGHGGESAGS